MDLLSKWQNRSSSQFVPLQASLELTNRCNERCKHCYIDHFEDDPSKVLSFEDWEVILTKLKEAGTLYIILMGGEAMLNPLFDKIARKSSELGFYTTLITNGLRIKTIEDAYKLKDAGIQQVTFSVYSLSSELHDELTQVRGSLDKTLSALHHCRNAGITVGVNTLITSKTVEDFPRIYHYFNEIGISVRDDVTITAKFSGDLTPTKLRARPEQLINYYRFKKSLAGHTSSTDKQEHTNFSEDYVCNVAKGKCAVTAYGDLLGCIEVRESLGSILKEDFQKIWNSPEAIRWRNIKNGELKGLNNNHSNCNHCLGMAKNELGDELQVLPYLRELEDFHSRT